MKQHATYLWVATSFEEWSHSDETNVVVPHHVEDLVVSRQFKGVLKDLKNGLAYCHVSGKLEWGSSTFKALSAGLFQERLLLTGIRNVPVVFRNLSHWVELEFPMLCSNRFGCALKRWINNLAMDLSFVKDYSILCHLNFLRGRRHC